MQGADADRLVQAYLDRLAAELRDLPTARREELLDEIWQHIEEARAEHEPRTEAELRTLLDRVGSPAEIAEEAGSRLGVEPAPPPRGGALEVTAIVLLLIGGFLLPVIGWLVGVALLWSSHVWSRRDKWLGTLVFPLGLSLPLFLLFLSTIIGTRECGTGTGVRCSDGPSELVLVLLVALAAVLIVGPLLTAAHLARQMRGSRGRS